MLVALFLVTPAGPALGAQPTPETCPSVTPDVSTSGSSAVVNDVIVSHIVGGKAAYGAAGSGAIDAFKRLQRAGTERGYNTSGTLESWDDDSNLPGGKSPALQLSTIPSLYVGGSQYRQLILDLNEPIGGNNPLISLDALELYCGDTSSCNDYPFAGCATKVYDLDSNGDVSVILQDLNAGSGEVDYSFAIPQSYFTAAGCSETSYIYVYSFFGACWASGGGFEEWLRSENAFVPPYDFGDLPDCYGMTSLEDDGANHSLQATPSPILGVYIDAEADGQPNSDATGDDINPSGRPDDEDGVVRNLSQYWLPGATVELYVTLTGNGYLVGWFDFYDNSCGMGNAVVFGTLSGGSHTLTITLPNDYVAGTRVCARFRLYAANPGTPSLYGNVANGEVEDYCWTFGPNAVNVTELEAQGGAAGRLRWPLLAALSAVALVTATAWRRRAWSAG